MQSKWTTTDRALNVDGTSEHFWDIHFRDFFVKKDFLHIGKTIFMNAWRWSLAYRIWANYSL